MFRGDAAHSGMYASQAPREFHRVKWKFPTGDRVVSSPVWQDNVIYFGGDDGNVYAVDATPGARSGSIATGGPVPSTPAVADGTVYAGSYDGKFYALECEDRRHSKWKFATAASGASKRKASRLAAQEPDDGRSIRCFPIESRWSAQGAVYFGSGDGNLYALDADSGELSWKFQDGRRGPCFTGICGWRSLLRKLG